ncbi:hypothetical protein IFM89_030163 [Coptis chinensis]|uniref:Uncharacterized protein n=1 Tax=Coptis chinensis TaxID=261450 RepID=A0A835H1V3_9MAGN|nr:hypothetical protein IFM89_030163 [Coptis chinensis]
MNSSLDLSDKDLDDEDYCNDEDGSKTTTNRAKFKGPLTKEESEGDSSDEGDDIDSDDAIDSDAELESSNPSSKESHLSSKTLRGFRRSKVMATDSGSKLAVTFNANGQPVGENSEQFSSHLGNIASEMVPLTFSDWRVIKKGYKVLYWQSILQKFILDKGLKTYALQQIGRLWWAHKSRLRGKIRIYRKKKKDIAHLQPEDCDDAEWEMFVKQMSKRKFILKSQKFQEMREKQDLPHTCSRQGYAHLEFQMVKAQSHSLVVWGNRNGWGFPFAFAKEQKVSRYP